MQKDSKIFDDLARMATGAAGGLLDFKREIEAMVSTQMEKLLNKMKLVTREEHEVVREMAAKAREENKKLAERLETLEKRLKEHTPR